MLGAVITPFLVVERDGREISDIDKASTTLCRNYSVNTTRQRDVRHGNVKRMGHFFPDGDVVVTGIWVVVRRESRRCRKVRRGRSTVGAKLKVNHAISGL